MIKKNNSFGYLICILIVAATSILLFCNKCCTMYLLRALADEFIVVGGSKNKDALLYEFIPMCEYKFDETEDYMMAGMYDEKGESFAVGENNGLTDNESKDDTSEDKEVNADTATTDKKQQGNASEETTQAKETTEKSTSETTTSESTEDDSSKKDDKPNLPVSTYQNGIRYERDKLLDFNYLVNNLYNIAGSTSVYTEELNAGVLLDMDMTLDVSGDDYKVLIYHTHGSEAFADSREGVLEDTVVGIGDELTRILEEDYGISTYHDRTVYDMASGTLDRSGAYDYSAEGIDKILAENPSIEVIIDLHRDGVNDDVHLVKVVDGRPTAQIMFLNGMSRLNTTGDIDYLYNQYKEENLSFSLKLELSGREKYGELLRPIFISGYCYNLNRMPRAALIEVGAQTNTLAEAKNAMIPLADILYSVLTGN